MIRERIIRLFYPKVCPACGKLVPIEKDRCDCLGKNYFEIDSDFCHRCGCETSRCCCDKPYSAKLDEITAPFYYSSAVKQRLIEFKFASKRDEGKFFGEKMAVRFAEVYSTVKADVVTYVPMSDTSVKARGYNQSEILAAETAKRLFLPCRELLVKTKETQSQHTLSAKERTKNLIDVFKKTGEDITGKVVILCDDIVTTGTTLSRCCDVLKAAGAKKIYCLCAAVTDIEL